MSRIFISHSSQNNAAAIAMQDWLVAQGYDRRDIFLDVHPERGIAAGERWERALNEAANRCEVVVFLVSGMWLKSEWCVREFRLADKLNKRMFGVLIEDIPISDLPSEMTRDWQLVNLAAGRDHETFRAVLPDGSVEQHVTFSMSGLARLKAGLYKAGLDPRYFNWPPDHDPGRAPYRGLKALEAEDAGIFFGREAETIATLDRLRGLAEATPPRLVAILGASGAGKSSFLRAGLLPRLARDDRNFLTLPVLRPERAAISGETGLISVLDQAFARAKIRRTRAEIRAAVESGGDGVIAALAQLSAAAQLPELPGEPRAPAPAVVLPIDQGEELFLGDGGLEAQTLLRLIRDLALVLAPRLMIILTIRSDSYERLQSAPSLEGIAQVAISLPPLPHGAYLTVIEGPAQRLAQSKRPLKIEPALTQALLADIEAGGAKAAGRETIGRDKDALPLLAFTLERLYLDHGGDGDMTVAEYDAIGGVKGSIEAAVEKALASAGNDPRVPRDRAAQLALLRRGLIPWLAGIDPVTNAPRRRVARLSEIPEEARPLVEHLIEARLLATDVNAEGLTTIEPAHEALLRQWSLLQGWLKGDTAALAALDAVKSATRDWEANSRNPDWLAHSAGRLEDADTFARGEAFRNYLGEPDREYLAACRARDLAARDRELEEARRFAEEQRRAAEAQTRLARQRTRWLAVAGMLAVLAGGAAWYGFKQAGKAERQAKEAEQARDQAQANFALARDTTKDIVVNLARYLRNVTGIRVEAIGAILNAADRTMAKLAEVAPDDYQLQRVQDDMLYEFTRTYLAAGDVEAAAQSAQKSLDIGRKLRALNPGDVEAQIYVASSLTSFGEVRLRLGDSQGALQSFQESRDICSKLIALNPNHLVARQCVFDNVIFIGDSRLRDFDFDAASKFFQEGLEIARKLDALVPGNRQAQRGILISLQRIGGARLEAGDVDGASKAYQESLDTSRKLVETEPGNIEARRDVAVGLQKIGKVRLRAGNADGALQAYQESLDITSKISLLDPSNISAKRDVSVSLDSIGEASLYMGDANVALRAYQDSLDIRRKIAAHDPGNVEAQGDVGSSLIEIGGIRLRAGDADGALKLFQESLEIARKLAALQPGNLQAQLDVVRPLNNIGLVRLRLGDTDGALNAYQEAVDITRKLILLVPDEMHDHQREFADVLDRIGSIRLRAGDADGALKLFQEHLEIARKLVVLNPSDIEARQAVAGSLMSVAWAALFAKQPEVSLRSANESIALSHSSIEKLEPQTNRAHALMYLNRLEEARAAYLENRGKILRDKRTWEAAILADFADLRKAGLNHRLMAEIEKAFAKPAR